MEGLTTEEVIAENVADVADCLNKAIRKVKRASRLIESARATTKITYDMVIGNEPYVDMVTEQEEAYSDQALLQLGYCAVLLDFLKTSIDNRLRKYLPKHEPMEQDHPDVSIDDDEEEDPELNAENPF